MICINTQSVEYQWLEESAGISKFKLHAFAQDFFNQHERLPKLHEIPGANSTNRVKEVLKLKEASGYLYTTKADIMLAVEATDLEDAIVKLNNIYTDLRIDATRDPMTDKVQTLGPNEEVNIFLDSKPSKWGASYEATVKELNMHEKANEHVMYNILDRLKPWGIKVHRGKSDELQKLLNKKKDIREGRHQINVPVTNGFIYDGEIYINMDDGKYNPATPIHELMHLLVGSMRFLNPTFYQTLLSSIELLPNWETLAEQYAIKTEESDGSVKYNRTINDINEEILVDQYAKYVTNQESVFKDMGSESLYEMLNNVQLLIDRALFGIQSAETIAPSLLYTQSFDSLISTLGSKIAILTPVGSLAKTSDGFQGDNALKYRILLNKKNALMLNSDFSNGSYKLELNCN